MQVSAADEFRGGVFAAFGTNRSLLMIVGVGIAGALGNVVEIVAIFDLAGILGFLASLIAIVAMRAGSLPVGPDLVPAVLTVASEPPSSLTPTAGRLG
jgi:hypothetical protein